MNTYALMRETLVIVWIFNYTECTIKNTERLSERKNHQLLYINVQKKYILTTTLNSFRLMRYKEERNIKKKQGKFM